MRVAIVGAGFTGLTSALRLSQAGESVSLFEASDAPGGLASGLSRPGWEWPVERFYHHIFTNDAAIIRLAHEVSWPPLFFHPETSVYFEDRIYPFDSVLDLLRFPHLSLASKVRMGATLGFLKALPFWKPLERFTADRFLRFTMGSAGYTTIWEPLLIGKFGPFAPSVNAAWFWARVFKRTARLGYFRRGFQGLADQIVDSITKRGGRVLTNHPVENVSVSKKGFVVRSASREQLFDRVLFTTSTSLFLRLFPALPDRYRSGLQQLASVDALVLLLVLRKPFMEGVYWLNVLSRSLPFLVLIEHTNMIDSKYYGGNHLLYLGTYLPSTDPLLHRSPSFLRHLAIRQLLAIRNDFDPSNITSCFVFRGPQAQPVVPVSYSSILPTISTPIPNLYLGNMNLVYPWDRGTNYAVELGEKLARVILHP